MGSKKTRCRSLDSQHECGVDRSPPLALVCCCGRSVALLLGAGAGDICVCGEREGRGKGTRRVSVVVCRRFVSF